jgi:hypothetical protein
MVENNPPPGQQAPAADNPPNNNLPTTASKKADFKAEIIKALNGVFVLHVTTVVGAATVQNADNGGAASTVTLGGGEQKVANSVINTVLGDTTHIYSPEFVSDSHMMDLHTTAVAAAREVRKETIDLLIKLGQNLETLFQS